MSANFDNIADEQALSPTLLDAYLNAAGDISRMAVGDKNAPSIDKTYTNQTYVSQHPWDHVEGAPYGTRGGMVVDHVFPADGEYALRSDVHQRRQLALRGRRHLDRRPARGAARLRERPADRRRRQRRDAALHRSGARQGRPAQGRGRVHQAHRRSVRRSDQAARVVERRRRLGRRRHHHASAAARRRHSRALQDHRRLDDAEPAEDLQLPSDLVGGRSAPARGRSSRASAAKPIDGRSPPPRSIASCRSTKARRRRTASRPACARRSKRSSPARTSSSVSRRRRPMRARAAPIASPTSTWRRGCRSSCGASRPTRN